MKRIFKAAVFSVGMIILIALPSLGSDPSVDQLRFKGTHNSYQSEGGTPPIMNHPPNVQIDDFGVWGLELDIGVASVTGIRTVVVGHNGPCDGIDPRWGCRLIDFLVAVRNTLAMHYRPVLLYLEPKSGDDWPTLDPNECADHVQKFELAMQVVAQVFGENVIELYKFVDEHNGRYPTALEMAGKVIVYFPAPDFSSDNPNAVCRGNAPLKPTVLGYDGDECTSREVIERQPAQVFRVDQYQADWTFEYGVPPNPLVVDGSAQPPWTVSDSVGDDWDCDNGDVWRGQVVHEHGTFRFPYRTIQSATIRAEGTTPNSFRDPRRAGNGWTVLIKSGTYPERLTIDIPLTLKKDDRFGGSVVIGR
jgi:hypothetical protein